MPPHSGLSEEEYQFWLKEKKLRESILQKRRERKIKRKQKKWNAKWKEECKLRRLKRKEHERIEKQRQRLKKHYSPEFTSFLDVYHSLEICKNKIEEFFRFDEESDDYLDDTKDEDPIEELKKIVEEEDKED